VCEDEWSHVVGLGETGDAGVGVTSTGECGGGVPVGEVVQLPWFVGKRQIYVIGSSRDGPLKVGLSIDPWGRKEELQPGHPEKLRVFATFVVRAEHECLEKKIHEDLREYRRSGEWFMVPIEMALLSIWLEHGRANVPLCPGSMGWFGEAAIREDTKKYRNYYKRQEEKGS
jgi:hypothetical protein